MVDMNIQDRYLDIAEISGLSEDIVRRVLRASKQSLCKTLAQGKTATLPGICTMDAELRERLSKTNSLEVVDYVRVKVKPSASMEADLQGMMSKSSKDINSNGLTIQKSELTFVQDNDSNGSDVGIRLKQINALL